jgi:drug/metabolite transporter (DMT)-like permease
MQGLSDNMRGSLLMMMAMAAFTVNDACMKAVTANLPLYQTIVLRGLLTTVALALIARRWGALRFYLPRGDMRLIGWRTLGEVAGTITFLSALKHMPLANLSAIMQSLPLAVTLAAALVFREPVGWRRMSAVAIGFSGVLLIVRPGPAGFDIWSLLGLASVGFVVLRDLATRRISHAVPSVMVALMAAVAVTSMAAVVAPFNGWAPVGLHQGLLICGAAIFLIIGYLSVVMAMRVGDISVVAPFRYTALVFAIVLGWFAFGQLPDPVTLLGALIVIATGIYTFYRERRRGQRLAMPDKAPLRLR